MNEKSDISKNAPGAPKKVPGLPPAFENKLEHLSRQKWGPSLWYLIFMLLMLWLWQEESHQLVTHTIPYSQFKTLAAQGRVTGLTISETEITGKVVPKPVAKSENKSENKPAAGADANSPAGSKAVTNAERQSATATNRRAATNPVALVSESGENNVAGTETYPFRTVRVEDPDLVHDLQKAGVEFAGERPAFISQLIWAWVLPIGAMILLWRFLSRRMGSISQGIMSIGSSKHRVVADKDTGVTFKDVAGCDEAKAELQEVVSFLEDPTRYKALGATIPKGILLIGPPGTGKTLLARAVAGEAKVPFFLISGSDFVEMFVGVGAARVRDLFEKAKAQAPCIVFIDELDAVGRQRGVHLGPVNDEREQTLNQLLVGMDGFEPNTGVIVLAATNRPEVLDHALLRPGRFDRQVTVDAPDLDGRLAILKLHVRDKPLAAEVDLRKIAAQTPGFSGADLANITNEAALLAARRGERQLNQKDVEDAVEKVVAGPERKSRRLGDEEKKRVAFHEVGHALVAVYSPHADPVHKITIIPHGHAALGYTLQLPTEDHYLMSRSALLDKIKGQLGGRAAEDVVFQEISTGAENDLERATALARQMVAMFGMSSVIGLVHCAQRQHPFAGAVADGILQRDCSEQTAREIDEEVKKLLDSAYAEAKTILQEHRKQLDLIAGELLERETLDGKTFRRLLEPAPAPGVQANG